MITNYINDGANHQAQAVLAFLQGLGGLEEESWCNIRKKTLAIPAKVARWGNCREQGYIVYLLSKDYSRQINIAFFEHRNSDSICAILWEQKELNSITIDTADFKGTVYKDKWDVSFSVDYGEVFKMAEWIEAQLVNFWKETRRSFN